MNILAGGIRASLARWLGVPITLRDGEFWREYYGGNSYTDMCVTVDSSLQLSTVWACVRLISETIATLPLGLYQRTADGARKAVGDHPLYELLHNQPNADMVAVTFWEAVFSSLLLWGNTYIEIRRVGSRIVALDFLLPERMKVKRRTDGTVEYRYLTKSGGSDRLIADDSIMHVPAFTVDGLFGLSPIAYAKNVFGNAMAADKAAGETYAKGMRSSGFLNVKGNLTPQQREDLKKSLEKFRGHEGAGRVFVTEGDSTFNSLSMNPEDAQLLTTRAFGVEEICRWYRVPPFMVGHSEKSTSWGTGIEQQTIGFIAFVLRSWCVRVEQSVRKSLLTAAERQIYFAEFALEGLLRADSAGRSAFMSTMVQNGIYTRDDCRQLENLPRRGGNADVLTVQSNLLPIDQLGTTTGGAPDALAARSALMDWLGLQTPETAKE